MPTPDRSGPRRPRRDSDSARPSRPSGAGARGPRRDDSRPSRPRSGDNRPSRPRRDDDRPSRPRSFDSDRPSRSRGGDDRPAGRGSPSSGRPSSGRPSSGRPSAGGRFADRDSRPSRPRGDDDRPSRARSFDSDRPSRPRRDDDRPPTRGRFGDRDSRPSRPRRDDDRPRSFDDRPARPQTDAQRRADQVRSRTGGRRYDRDAAPRNDHQQERWNDEGSTRAPRRGSGSRDNDAPIHLERDEKRASAPALAHVEATVGKKIAGIVGDQAAKRLIGKLALALDAFEKGRYQDAKRIIIPITRELRQTGTLINLTTLALVASLLILQKPKSCLCLLNGLALVM